MRDDVLIEAKALRKRFCRSLKRAMWYTGVDVAREALGLCPQENVLRPQEFWALKDVSFDLHRGECLGLIGPNGSGKSTLLRVLNGIINPDGGYSRIRGNVGALIQVGAGFHPTLTGRENVYVTGAIRGMSKREIDAKYDAIVEFSGVEEFIDMPVQHYSAGMFVRLGYAVAAHIDPDVLLMDEVLAVGDAEFRAKCLDHLQKKMADGCSPVFVSHSMVSVYEICTRVIVLDRGAVAFDGPVNEGIALYQDVVCRHQWQDDTTGADSPTAPFDVDLFDQEGDGPVLPGDAMRVRIRLGSRKGAVRARVQLHLQSASHGQVGAMLSPTVEFPADGCPVEFTLTVPELHVQAGSYLLVLHVVEPETSRSVARRLAQLPFRVSAPGGAAPESRSLLLLSEAWDIAPASGTENRC